MSDGQKRYETKRHAEFFRAEACKKLYKDHVAFLTNRTNAYNGIQYKNDPTILAWNLINEPRCETWMPENSWCHQGVADWFKVRRGVPRCAGRALRSVAALLAAPARR
jgi:hypothetical protein